ncbi:MAG: HIT family protein, partial [Chitinophagaceae bacterium]
YRIAENENFYAFLDISPLCSGHTLIVPKLEMDYIFDLPEKYLYEMLLFARPIALAIQQAVPCKRVGMAVIGLEVPHAHLHLVPINNADDLNFTRAKLNLSPELMKSVQDKICSNLK